MPDPILTTLHLDLKHPDVRRDSRDVCRMHARVEDLTSTLPDSGPRVLWAQPRPGLLIVRAPSQINASRLPAGYARTITHRPWMLPAGGMVRAVAVVNPTTAVAQPRTPDGKKPRGRRTPITCPREQATWLAGRLTPHMSDVRVTITGARTAAGRRPSTGDTVRHLRAVAEITGTVADPEGLRELAAAGIGHGRAYGCGLTIWAAAC